MMNADARREHRKDASVDRTTCGPEKRSNTADAFSKLQAENGITLIELVLASSLMGILFFSGLQLLSAVFSVQSAIMPHGHDSGWSNVRLEAYLRNKLQSVSEVEIGDNGQSIQTRQFRLRFQRNRACGGFLLLIREDDQTPRTLFRWKNARSSPGFAWSPHAPHLLDIFLGEREPRLSIWLRNDA